MTQLTTDVRTHVIVTYTGVHYPITAVQEQALQKKGLDEEVRLEGNTIKMKNIADVLTMEKYRETYPEKQSKNYGQPYTKIEEAYPIEDAARMLAQGMTGVISKSMKSKNALEASLRGISRFLSENPKSQFAIKHKARIEEKLKELAQVEAIN